MCIENGLKFNEFAVKKCNTYKTLFSERYMNSNKCMPSYIQCIQYVITYRHVYSILINTYCTCTHACMHTFDLGQIFEMVTL